jgi:CubicO group peptidase (beta-lactamase class C family)
MVAMQGRWAVRNSTGAAMPLDWARPNRRALLGGLSAAAGSALLGVGGSGAARGETMAWPSASWVVASPESVGLSRAKLLEAQAFATKFGGGAGCVVRWGRLVHSWGALKQRYPINSATKSWGSVVLGWAVDEGRVTLRGRVQSQLPNLGYKPSGNAATGWLDDITYEMLATHTGGFDKPGKYAALIAQPGSRYIYSDTGPNWLANALTNSYRQNLRDLTLARLFQPLGLTSEDIDWRKTNINFTEPVYGIPATEFNGGMSANADAMARLGHLYLNRGEWNGRRIVSAGYVDLSTRPYYPTIAISNLRSHGLLWWSNGGGWQQGVPRDAYWSTGKNNNHTLVVPSLGLVAVRVGTDGWSNHGGQHWQFFKPICDAALS